MLRRELLHLLALASAAGLPLDGRSAARSDPTALYEFPRFGNVGLLHFTDCHAQLLPVYYREPGVNIGVGTAVGRPPHVIGEAMLRRFGIASGPPKDH